MAIVRIKIENFKSVKKCDISISDLNLIIGENGTGKTNILEAVNYFYENMLEQRSQLNVFDVNNSLNNEVKIEIFFDMSAFVKISKANSEDGLFLFSENKADKKYSNYYKKIKRMAYNSPNNILCLEMKQIKGKNVEWNFDYEDRFIFKSLFPLFFIDTRCLDLTEWKDVWNAIGDLSKVSNPERAKLQVDLQKLISDIERETSQKIKSVEEVFEASGIAVQKAPPKDFARLISQLYFEGSTFVNKGKSLKYFSNGTNSVNYIRLLLKTIFQISKNKLKEPLVIIDEPEINLHPSFVDDLTTEFIDDIGRIRLIVATHSARIVKNIIRSEINSNVYNVKMLGHYTVINKIKLFTKWDSRAKFVVTDEHANAYFSRAILLVEGETELELFSNPYLRILFPELNHIDVYKALSDNVVRDIIRPNKINTKTPYLFLIDMDKAIKYEKSSNKFALAEYLKENEYTKKEKMLYNQKNNGLRQSVYYTNKRIFAMTNKCRFHIFKPMYSCKDSNFLTYINLIKDYLINYNIFACSTTVEGLLITKESSQYIFEYTKTRKKEFAKFSTYYSTLLETDKLNSLRLLYKGKTDLLLSLKHTDLITNERDIIACNQTDKTDGWVSKFINYYFQVSLKSHGIECASLKDFIKIMSDLQMSRTVRLDFENTYPELQLLLTLSCQMLSSII